MAGFDESLHPRAPDGKFGAGGGGAKLGAAKGKAKAAATAIVESAKVKAAQIRWKGAHDAAKATAALQAGKVPDPKAALAKIADIRAKAEAKAQAVVEAARAKAEARTAPPAPPPAAPAPPAQPPPKPPATHGDQAEPKAGENGAEPAPVWEKKKNPKRVEAAKKAAAASVERRREIYSAVASNLPHELQATWSKEGHKFMQQESGRIRGVKDRINAASKISEAFAEQYGSGAETAHGNEGDRYHRRAEIEATHAESWADEQEKRYYAAAARAAPSRQPARTSAKTARYDDEVPF